DHESRNTDGHIWDIVSERGIEVKVIPQIICDFYNAPYYDQVFIDETDLEYFWDIDMDNIINYLIEGIGEWKYCPGTSIPSFFNQAIMFPEAEISRCALEWIYQNMKRCISGKKVGVFFPHLMTALCKRAGVPMESTEQQEMMTTPALSQRLTRAQYEFGESSHPKLDWMIQWMQESGLIFQEFAKQNNIEVPNYTLDMFGPTPSR
ncbi:hypothetical protein Golax_025984, partial [Gossypium laxum]|nr:hypothetical protein [Gossypium laxum]